jgi:hypothetical protein
VLRLAYLGVTNAFAVLRVLPMSNRDKDVEILALRHHITVPERLLGKEKMRFDAGDRAPRPERWEILVEKVITLDRGFIGWTPDEIRTLALWVPVTRPSP